MRRLRDAIGHVCRSISRLRIRAGVQLADSIGIRARRGRISASYLVHAAAAAAKLIRGWDDSVAGRLSASIRMLIQR
jgi:hypothetical protein